MHSQTLTVHLNCIKYVVVVVMVILKERCNYNLSLKSPCQNQNMMQRRRWEVEERGGGGEGRWRRTYQGGVDGQVLVGVDQEQDVADVGLERREEQEFISVQEHVLKYDINKHVLW